MSSDSETNESLSVARSLDESKDLDEDWRVIESEIRPYYEEPLAHIPHEEDVTAKIPRLRITLKT